ncbi:MAG: hypothetical protein ACSHWW_02925 [Nonlabens sp.]|uniref:hypothetical protein n=1 Tax=Nonlabens sp. TaxID=1888209 RepID=UPI003EF9DE62
MHKLLITYKAVKNIAILLVCMSSSTMFAQITSTEFLQSVSQSSYVQLDEAKSEFLNTANYRLPLFKNIQLRSESRDFLLNRQEYAVRAKPNSFNALFKQKALQQSKIDKQQAENQLRFNKILKGRYTIILQHAAQLDLVTLYQKRKEQLEKKMQLLELKVYDTDFNVEDLIHTEAQIKDATLKITQAKEKIQELALHSAYELQLDQPVYLNDFKDLIDAQDVIALKFEQATITSQKVNYVQKKLSVLEQELKVDLAEDRQLIDFVQAKYGGKKNTFFDENFSIGIGINLPFFGNQRQKKNEYQLKKLDEQQSLIAAKEEFQFNQIHQFQKFENLKKQYLNRSSQLENSSITKLLELYKNSPDVPAMRILKLEIIQHKNKIELVKLEYELLESYLYVLDATEELYQAPLVNHLSRFKVPLQL